MKVNSAQFFKSSPRADMCPGSTIPEYAFIGRSNVGKSSLINMLTGRKGLAMTSSTPGKTMLINHFIINAQLPSNATPDAVNAIIAPNGTKKGQGFFIVDLPGYGFALRGKREMDKLWSLISHYVLDRSQLTCLFVLIDIRLEPQKKDLDFFEFLGENGVPFSIIFTKADKLSRSKAMLNVKAYMDKLQEQWEELPPYFITSSTTRQGHDELLDYIDSINETLL